MPLYLVRRIAISDVARVLIKNGFEAMLFYDSAIASYLNRGLKERYLITNADIVSIARLFDNVDYKRSRCYDICIDGSCIKVFDKVANNKKSYIKDVIRDINVINYNLVYDIKSNVFYDLEGATYLIRHGIIATKSKHASIYDIMDIARIISIYNMKLDKDVVLDGDIRVDDEVIRQFFGIITSPYPYRALKLLDRYNIIGLIFPSLIKLRDIRQTKDFHPEGNVYIHTLRCFKFVKNLPLHLALAILFHDIGKYRAKTIKGNKLSFPRHADIGYSITLDILRGIGIDSATARRSAILVKYHMLPPIIESRRDYMTLENIYRMGIADDLLTLYRADLMSSYGDIRNYERVRAFFKMKDIAYGASV